MDDMEGLAGTGERWFMKSRVQPVHTMRETYFVLWKAMHGREGVHYYYYYYAVERGLGIMGRECRKARALAHCSEGRMAREGAPKGRTMDA